MNVPETVEAQAEPVTSVYEAYAQLVKMLLPSSGCVAIYAVNGDMTWCSDGFERPDFRELVEDFRSRNQGLAPNQGVIRDTSAGATAVIARLGDAAGHVLGYALVELGRTHSNSGKSMAASMTRPLFRCLASQLAIEGAGDREAEADAKAEDAAPAAAGAAPAEDPRLGFLLGIGDIDLGSPHAIGRLLERCVDHLDCLSAVFCIPNQDLTEMAEGAADAETRAQLDATRKHLLAWVQLNNRAMVVNRVDSVKAPYKILSCPVSDTEGRPAGLIALFRGAQSPNFELDDVRLIEFLARQAMTMLSQKQDELSGLMTQGAFERRLEEEIGNTRGAVPGTLLYLDINDLKGINHSFGYKTGDEAMLRVAQLIRRSLMSNEFGCRIAADRFVVYLPERDADGTAMLAAELVQSAEALGFASAGRRVPLSLRFGFAAAGDAAEARHWIAAAELACQQGRRQG
jgi:diguanylate cyclase (GGDEF)-like protein